MERESVVELFKEWVRALFWFCPHGLRRSIYRFFKPRRWSEMISLRQGVNAAGYSFKPFLEQGCLFIHIPKAAGISVARGLFGNLAGGHTMMRDYMIAFDRREFEGLYKFTFVRNPWDRLYSAYQFLRAGGMNEGDRSWAGRHLAPFRDFRDFVERWVDPLNIRLKVHFYPQVWFLREPGRSDLRLDFIGHYERLREDFEVVRKRLGIRAILARENKTRGRREDYRDVYTPKMRRIVERVYREDIELLGYGFDRFPSRI